MKLKETISEQPYWPCLFGKLRLCQYLQSSRCYIEKPLKDREIRIKYACLALLESVLLPTSLKMKISGDHAEAIKDLEAFCCLSLGEKRDEIALSRDTIAVKGFALALQLVMVEAIPALTEVVQDTCSSLESYSEDIDGNGLDNFTKKQNPLRPIDEANIYWSDEEHDSRVDSMLARITRDYPFNNSSFRGGVRKIDVDRMRVFYVEPGYITARVIEKIKPQFDLIENNLKVTSSRVAAIEGNVKQMITSIKEMVSAHCKEHLVNPHGTGKIPTSAPNVVSIPPSQMRPVADANALTIRDILRDINHVDSGYVCVTLVPQLCAQSANSENRSRQNSFQQSLVDEGEPMVEINVADNIEVGQLTRKSKRQKTVRTGLVEDYQCDPHLLSRRRESQRCIFVIQDISEIRRKYAKLVPKLKGKFVLNISGLALYAKEILFIVERPRIYSAKVVDILIRVLRSVIFQQLPKDDPRSAAFLDTKFVFAIMRNFPKFLKSKNEEGYVFPKGLSDIFLSKEAPKLHPTRYYFPFNMLLYLAKFAGQPIRADPVIQCYDFARPKSVAQTSNPADSGLMALLLMENHTLYGLEACKNISKEMLEEEGKRAAILAYEFEEEL
ncbi:hypothetical protein Bca52824_016619 [Brassica carinata]|uniref:DUF1985 domain-containing protein n=1 Tax=Brassica carinata TaxID=52824 RepID=A0A8X7W4C7_BRACI|nr:hypothetical protein Bca52824_016619 [Brassica carinata]